MTLLTIFTYLFSTIILNITHISYTIWDSMWNFKYCFFTFPNIFLWNYCALRLYNITLYRNVSLYTLSTIIGHLFPNFAIISNAAMNIFAYKLLFIFLCPYEYVFRVKLSYQGFKKIYSNCLWERTQRLNTDHRYLSYYHEAQSSTSGNPLQKKI